MQGAEDMPRELRSFEKGLAQQKEESLERVARSHTATMGVGCDGFHPRYFNCYIYRKQ